MGHQIAGRRWTIEECFQQAQKLTGLDEYEVSPFAAGITVPVPISRP